MKRLLLSMCIGILSLTFATANVEAKRLGGGISSGIKREALPPAPANQPSLPAVAPKPAATPSGPATAPAVAPQRSWLGPIAGIAAGLGIAALMSHFGMGGDFANILTILLMAGAAVFAVRFLMQRFGAGAKPANANLRDPSLSHQAASPASGTSDAVRSDVGLGTSSESPDAAAPLAVVPTRALALPADFDAPAFERIAKLIFIRMQAANDAGNLEDLRQFATPEMFALFRLDLQERTGKPQQTDVLQLDAQVLDVAQETDHQVVSVRFHGLIREAPETPAASFDETWHLVKPAGNHADAQAWSIAGIAQNMAA